MHLASSVSAATPGEQKDFSLTRGGPFYELLVRLRILTPSGATRVWWLAILLWLPLAIGEGVRAMAGLPLDPLLHDLSVHVRVLFTFPVMVIAERLIETRPGARSVASTQATSRMTPRSTRSSIAPSSCATRAPSRPRCSCLAFLGGQLVLWEVFGPTGWIHGGARSGSRRSLASGTRSSRSPSCSS